MWIIWINSDTKRLCSLSLEHKAENVSQINFMENRNCIYGSSLRSSKLNIVGIISYSYLISTFKYEWLHQHQNVVKMVNLYVVIKNFN